MELTTTLTAACRVAASLQDDGSLTVSVFAQADYKPGASTTAQVTATDIPDALRMRLQGVLKEILASVEDRLGPQLQRAVYKSLDVAAAMGEW